MTTKSNRPKFTLPILLLTIFWILAIVLWRTSGNRFYLFNFGYIGTALGLGLGLYAWLPRAKRPLARRLAQFLIGIYMLVFLGFMQRENMQIEGFFFYLLAGIFAGAVIHYFVAKVFGTFIFNRGWCGWACWTAMILDLLPWRRNLPGRLPARWSRLRYLHFGVSLGLVVWLWFGLGYRMEEQSQTELMWLVAGNLFYYFSAILLAIALKDNRAFCKYLCPIPTLQKIGGRHALLKVEGDAGKCVECGACTRVCPMDIQVSFYHQQGKRVLSSECI